MLKLKTFSTNYSDVHTTFGKGPTKPFTCQRERKVITSTGDTLQL